jgi:hypothetical protein
VNVFSYGDDFSVPGEIIPACGARRNILDMREPQITLHRTYGRTSWKPNYDKGELTITCGSTIPILNEIQYEAAAFRKISPLSRIILLVDPDIFREHIAELAHMKFFRDERREDAHQRAFVVVRECKPIPPGKAA